MVDEWSMEENLATVDSYVSMLKRELAGTEYVKAHENRDLRERLNNRSRGAVEFKYQNISAVMLELGWLCLRGYKPASNVQKSLRYAVEQILRLDSELEELMNESTSASSATMFEAHPHFSEIAPPKSTIRTAEWTPRTIGIRRDYVYRDATNRAIGLAGELAMVAHEKQRLTRISRPDLAERVEHVSMTVGDGLGYDIKSFSDDGADLHIEVKTTRFGEKTPFFVTANEVRASEFFDHQFQLARVFLFDSRPGLFKKRGPLRDTCDLVPESFVALTR